MSERVGIEFARSLSPEEAYTLNKNLGKVCLERRAEWAKNQLAKLRPLEDFDDEEINAIFSELHHSARLYVEHVVVHGREPHGADRYDIFWDIIRFCLGEQAEVMVKDFLY